MNVWQKGTSPNHSLVQVCCKASFFITSCIWQNVLNVWKMALCRPHIFLFKVYRVGGTALYHKISSNYHSSKKLVPCLFLSGPLLHFRFHLHIGYKYYAVKKPKLNRRKLQRRRLMWMQRLKYRGLFVLASKFTMSNFAFIAPRMCGHTLVGVYQEVYMLSPNHFRHVSLMHFPMKYFSCSCCVNWRGISS